MMKIKLIAVAGPTASGKTHLAKMLAKKLGKDKTTIVSQDDYYKDWSSISLEEREKINFDHPDSVDFKLLAKHLRKLKNGETVNTPVYSFKKHIRLSPPRALSPAACIIVEGILVLCKKSLRDLFDIKVYVDANSAVSFARRLKRDVEERGETAESVCKRYFEDVLPMQEKYVQPQKKTAGFVIKENREFKDTVDELSKLVLGGKSK